MFFFWVVSVSGLCCGRWPGDQLIDFSAAAGDAMVPRACFGWATSTKEFTWRGHGNGKLTNISTDTEFLVMICWRWNQLWPWATCSEVVLKMESHMKIYNNLVSMLGGCGKPQFADLPGTRSMAGQACTAELRGLLLVAPVHVSWQGKSTWWIPRDTQLWQHRWFAWLWSRDLYYHILPINELVLLLS